MSWRPLAEFRDPSVGKIHRLGRASAKGLEVPPTRWGLWKLPLGSVEAPRGIRAPFIVRSASHEEDRSGGTAAGKFDSVVVESDGPAELRAACVRVLESMGGEGHIFCQPLMERVLAKGSEENASAGEPRGGVLFFDGFFYERTEAAGHNRELTAGTERGEVKRADLVRGEPFSDWLRDVGRVFSKELAGGGALDVEYARVGDRCVLLQARPARFAVRRNPILSLANHREILGDLPSPWIVDALCRAGQGALGEFARIDPEVGEWNASYAEAHGGRAWLSFSFFFRLMDHWGLPRTFVTEGVGGEQAGPLDGRANLTRMLRSSPRLIRLQLQNRRVMGRIPAGLVELDQKIDRCESVADWFGATAAALDFALRTNFAINGALSGAVRVRRALRIRGRARVVTEVMMEEYEALRHLPRASRTEALSAWLGRFGHRGPLESDPMQPRFLEMEDALLADLMGRAGSNGAVGSAPAVTAKGRVRRRDGWWFRLDRAREEFRDELMKRWVRLRAGTLEAAERHVQSGELDSPGDVFLIGEDVVASPEQWGPWIVKVRAERAILALTHVPMTARLDEIQGALESAAGEHGSQAGAQRSSQVEFRGIGIGARTASGTVVKASDLPSLLADIEAGVRAPLDGGSVLLVPALEPSWGILFGRVGAVVTDIGGELSHASILLREAGRVAVVNCAGASRTLRDGDQVLVNGKDGIVSRISPNGLP